MSEVTLDEIKATQTKLDKMIKQFEAQATTAYLFQEAEIKLHYGEHYTGIILGKDGEPNHHLILLPGEAESITWEDAKAWASEVGGELPSRREQALLYANLKEQFKPNWYWSSEQHSNSVYACCQYFDDGNQDDTDTSSKLSARAVRRLVIE